MATPVGWGGQGRASQQWGEPLPSCVACWEHRWTHLISHDFLGIEPQYAAELCLIVSVSGNKREGLKVSSLPYARRVNLMQATPSRLHPLPHIYNM